MNWTTVRVAGRKGCVMGNAKNVLEVLPEYGGGKIEGLPIRIFLPPAAPASNFICGTSYVWRVHPEDVQKYTGVFDDYRFVCEHQIEID